MTIDTDVQEFLEHFGVKGQRWGQRKARKPAFAGIQKREKERSLYKQAKRKPKSERTPEERSALRRRRVELTLVALTLGVSAAAVAMKIHGNRQIAEMYKNSSPQIKTGENAVASLLKMASETKR